MSASLWDWSLASADGLLTTEECSLLLDADILNTDDGMFSSQCVAFIIFNPYLKSGCRIKGCSIFFHLVHVCSTTCKFSLSGVTYFLG